jgi:hypothetical protein
LPSLPIQTSTRRRMRVKEREGVMEKVEEQGGARERGSAGVPGQGAGSREREVEDGGGGGGGRETAPKSSGEVSLCVRSAVR